MGKKISISQLSAAVMEELEEYVDLATEDMKSAVKKAAATVRKDIEAGAPRNNGDYAKSWTVKTTKESSNVLQITVHSRNRYQLAHLLEYGHAKFKRDIFKDLSKLEKSYKGKTENGEELQIEDLEIFENVAYVMAYHADNSIPAKIEDWLDQFDMFSIYEVLSQILELWGENLVTDVTSKKDWQK